MCDLLAKHFSTLWCPEYAREYLLNNGVAYNYDTLLEIAKGQIALEEKHERLVNASCQHANQKMLFIDTDMYVIKIWSEFVFNKCQSYILHQIATRPYDLYLLCKPDLPWQYDVLREAPRIETRNQLYTIYKEHMISQHVPWIEIYGSYEQRLQLAIDAVNKII